MNSLNPNASHPSLPILSSASARAPIVAGSQASRKSAKLPEAKGSIDVRLDDGDKKSVASSHDSAQKSAASVAPQKVITPYEESDFKKQLTAVAQQTKIARNIMPMIVRGGIIASMGMFLFGGHMAPLAILGTLIGAIVGGYVIAKVMQMKLARKYAAMGEENPLLQLKNNIPANITQDDLNKLQHIWEFVEHGYVFEPGMLKAVKEPWNAAKKLINKQFGLPGRPARLAPPPAMTKDDSSVAADNEAEKAPSLAEGPAPMATPSLFEDEKKGWADHEAKQMKSLSRSEARSQGSSVAGEEALTKIDVVSAHSSKASGVVDEDDARSVASSDAGSFKTALTHNDATLDESIKAWRNEIPQSDTSQGAA